MCARKTKSRLFGKWCIQWLYGVDKMFRRQTFEERLMPILAWSQNPLWSPSLADVTAPLCQSKLSNLVNCALSRTTVVVYCVEACYCVANRWGVGVGGPPISVILILIQFICPNYRERRVLTQIKERKCVQHINVLSPYWCNKPQKRSEAEKVDNYYVNIIERAQKYEIPLLFWTSSIVCFQECLLLPDLAMLEVMAFAPGKSDFFFFQCLTEPLFGLSFSHWGETESMLVLGAAQPQQNGGGGGNGRGRKHNRFLIKLKRVNLHQVVTISASFRMPPVSLFECSGTRTRRRASCLWGGSAGRRPRTLFFDISLGFHFLHQSHCLSH